MARARVPDRDPLTFLHQHDAADRRRLKAALLAAALAHGGLLLLAFPTEPMAAETPPKQRPHFLLETYVRPRPKPTPPKPRVEPVAMARRVPMPMPPDPPPLVIEPAEPLPIALATHHDANPVPLPAVTIPTLPPPPATPIRVSGAEAPERIHFVQPRYSEMARKLHQQGTVILDAIIAPSGRVESITVLRSLPFGLTESAIEAVEQWRYAPPRVGGRAMPVRMTVSVHFSLD